MGTIRIGDQQLACEQISRTDGERTYEVIIHYEEDDTAKVTRTSLDADARIDVTEDGIATELEQWLSSNEGAFVRSFTVHERIECRTGVATDGPGDGTETVDASDATMELADRDSANGSSAPSQPIDFGVGEKVAFHVDGPESRVYGYVREGIVKTVPPWTRGTPGRGNAVTDRAKIEVGRDVKEIPLEWILGPTSDDDVAAQVDRHYDDG